MKKCLGVIVLVVVQGISGYKRQGTEEEYHVAARWDFEDGLDGWAQASWEQLGAEMYAQDGELRGRVQRAFKPPRFDSPMMSLVVNDDYVVAMRIKHSGSRPVNCAVSARLLDWAVSQEDVQALSMPFGDGPGSVVTVPFDRAINSDGIYEIVYAPLHEVIRGGSIVQLRILPLSTSEEQQGHSIQPWSTFEIDWIQLVKRPSIDKVEGCINKYFEERPLPLTMHLSKRSEDGVYEFRGGAEGGNNAFRTSTLPSNEDNDLSTVTEYQTEDSSRRYASTMNCPRDGRGWRLRITGRNFGDYSSASEAGNSAILWDTVHIDGQPCTDVAQVVPQSVLECTLPRASAESKFDRVAVSVAQPALRGLVASQALLSYAVAPPKMAVPAISNVASHSVDLSWQAPSNDWDAVTVTGYRVRVYRAVADPLFHWVAGTPAPPVDADDGRVYEESHAVVLGNVTKTTLVGLEPNQVYKLTVEALCEDQRDPRWKELDLYGRRNVLESALSSVPSERTEPVSTLGHDVLFTRFDINATLAHGAVDPRQAPGPARTHGGQGHYGLDLVGDAHVSNCNATSACCDWPADVDPATADPASCPLMCSRIDPDVNASRYVGPYRAASVDPARSRLERCGSSLRLTGSSARRSGAAWYPRKMNVREGFSTEFTFEISNPSLVCQRMDDVHTSCRSRGADGLAFVVQNDNAAALGGEGRELGYGGIANLLAVEFDTFYNVEQQDPYENHVAVISRGRRWSAQTSHAYELGGTPAPVDLTDGQLRVKVVYDPRIPRPEHLATDAFVTRTHAAFFMSGSDGDAADQEAQAQGRAEMLTDELHQADVAAFRERDWEHGFGLISVYINDMNRPVFVNPLNLGSTLALDSGRAWVGFTAATGRSFWQAHDIRDWTFDSLRISEPPKQQQNALLVEQLNTRN